MGTLGGEASQTLRGERSRIETLLLVHPSNERGHNKRGHNDVGVYNVRKLDFQATLCEAFGEDKKQHYYGDLVWDGKFSKILFSTIGEQDFN